MYIYFQLPGWHHPCTKFVISMIFMNIIALLRMYTSWFLIHATTVFNSIIYSSFNITIHIIYTIHTMLPNSSTQNVPRMKIAFHSYFGWFHSRLMRKVHMWSYEISLEISYGWMIIIAMDNYHRKRSDSQCIRIIGHDTNGVFFKWNHPDNMIL